MLNSFLPQISGSGSSLIVQIVSILISFLLSALIAWTYYKTFQGLSYSRSYLQALILGSVVTTIAMLAIGDSLTRGLGMMGALAMIRFRSSLRDQRDMIFIFAGLSVGIASGVLRYDLAAIGTIFFCTFAFVLFHSPFSHRNRYDGLLRFNFIQDQMKQAELEAVLKQFCKVFALVTLRELAQGKEVDVAYQIKLKSERQQSELLSALKGVSNIKDISILLQEATIEL